ncbi:MAG: hypothetical protein ACD_62C00170G0022 [uncultured bacterium]|nr:MAG: hypothetical protein ACD_62C00170G0022 [uncultured bacterium]
MKDFQGSMVAIVTPFKGGFIDELALRGLIDFQLGAGTSCVVPCGTTGESATLSEQEFERVVAITVEHVAGRAKVLAGAGSNDTQRAIKRHKFCKAAGAQGSLQITPYYNKPPQEGLYQHFQAIAKSADLPIVLYNVPGRTAVNMLPQTTVRLSKIDTIVGIKEASGNLDQAKTIIQETDDFFALLSGEDALTCDLYRLGARGAISVTCNITPRECARQYRAVQEGDFDTAQKIHEDLLALHKILFVETNPIPVKAVLAMMGFIQEEYRLPLVCLSPENRDKLKTVLADKGFSITSRQHRKERV